MVAALAVFSSLLLTAPADSTPKRFSIFPFPLIYYTPETRLAYGVAATMTFRFRRDTLPTVRPSQVTVGAAYTQNKQTLFYVPFQVFYDQNRYYSNGEVGYYTYSYYFFGLGQREVPRELYSVKFPRIRVNAFRRVADQGFWKNLYAGARFQYEDYDVTQTSAGGLLGSGEVPGGLGSRLWGAGAGFFFDTRDNIFYPSKGVVADFAYLINSWESKFSVGKTVTDRQVNRFGRYVLDVASYHKLTDRAILAVNYVVSMSDGAAPFNALSLLGGTKRMRGYYEGRFRDWNVALLQAEGRVSVWRRVGVVAFGSVGVLGNNRQLVRLADPKGAYGAGLRIRINRDRLNIRADYGFGRQSNGLYLTVGEAF
ncbi:hypothetical protein BN8_04282 [Fibrisoma limi BUZ 3]|uniref:Bacterial surface antigen (D15) domain-containing protein n=1 Tax=Fibrisoma limi BUZ 3 TaxID=1185876 RepID=I2GMC3_9BACT|nr:BamA/TamA family outer membrane protein [Fibrisoma limi]CCH55050.1 hypothetical protein BN8_04282 [Fibrisoma limi BUZ 3]